MLGGLVFGLFLEFDFSFFFFGFLNRKKISTMAKGVKKSTKPVPSSNWKKLLPVSAYMCVSVFVLMYYCQSIAPKADSKKRKLDDKEEFKVSPNYKCFNKKQKLE